MTDLTPREIVSELDRFVVGQNAAKRAVALALRSRWRRKQLDEEMRAEITPKNILLIGPTGVGKTEISRRLAKLVNAPFLKVEATKFTEVGYVGRDVESIIRDLLEVAMENTREKMREDVRAQAHAAAEKRVIDALAGDGARDATRNMFRDKLRSGELDDTEIEIEVADTAPAAPMFELPGQGAQVTGFNINDLFGKAFGPRLVRKKMRVADSHKILVTDEADKLLDDEVIKARALAAASEDGIVFLDEIDKIATRQDGRGGEVSREGVQRDLLPLIEGTSVTTKYGVVKTDHILFIASGAFHVSKPSDLLPELQGRLPIRVELNALSEEDFRAILTDTDNALTRQYSALLKTEAVDLSFSEDGIVALSSFATKVNAEVENIGARRLYTLMERIFEELSFSAPDRSGEAIIVDAKFVESNLGDLLKIDDLSRFML